MDFGDFDAAVLTQRRFVCGGGLAMLGDEVTVTPARWAACTLLGAGKAMRETEPVLAIILGTHVKVLDPIESFRNEDFGCQSVSNAIVTSQRINGIAGARPPIDRSSAASSCTRTGTCARKIHPLGALLLRATVRYGTVPVPHLRTVHSNRTSTTVPYSYEYCTLSFVLDLAYRTRTQ